MPYTAQKDRKTLDPHINALAEAIVACAGEQKSDGAFTGLLNYSCTRLALKVIKLKFGALHYWILAATVGTFKNVADEFYRRIGIPYEDKQIAKNGDVDLYREFSEDIKKL